MYRLVILARRKRSSVLRNFIQRNHIVLRRIVCRSCCIYPVSVSYFRDNSWISFIRRMMNFIGGTSSEKLYVSFEGGPNMTLHLEMVPSIGFTRIRTPAMNNDANTRSLPTVVPTFANQLLYVPLMRVDKRRMIMPMPPQAWATLIKIGLMRGYNHMVLFATMPKEATKTANMIVTRPNCEWVVAKWLLLCLNLLTTMMIKPMPIRVRPVVCSIQCNVTRLGLVIFDTMQTSPEMQKTASVIMRPTCLARDIQDY